ncbi:hypothetical protein [Streptomyces sp. NBC_00986]|uniref:hypothetical protein n=1 Tax=Streptomyces sp. NBC_00986 TaxID=2903702 RepID=UPI00386818C6|nr:hypothetical protein OG504_39260 [Streptomyces sp. NBC_00986]
MLLYHFTDAEHWNGILAAGEIRATWQRRNSPPTVHLCRDPDPEALPWALRDRRLRILVCVPDAEVHYWPDWVPSHLRPEEQWSLLASSDPSKTSVPNQWNGTPEEWFVVERAVPITEWEEVIDLDTRSCLWPERPAL